MIPVPELTEANEPALFGNNCRNPGKAWLAANPAEDPHVKQAWWSQFKPDLAKHFRYRCGWLGTSIEQEGHVDHYLACGNRRDDDRKNAPSPHRHLAFEWSNYRYASGVVNSRKGNHDDAIMDPCGIKEGWFEVILHGFQIVVTTDIPDEHRAQAEFTLKTLDLRNGHHARMARWKWYERYWNNGSPDLQLLDKDAPMIAAAVRKAQSNGQELPNPAETEPTLPIAPRQRPYQKRSRSASNTPRLPLSPESGPP